MTFDDASAKWPTEVREYVKTALSENGLRSNDPICSALIAQVHVTEYLERRRRRFARVLICLLLLAASAASYTFGRAQQFQIFYGQFYAKSTEVKPSIIDGKLAYILTPK